MGQPLSNRALAWVIAAVGLMATVGWAATSLQRQRQQARQRQQENLETLAAELDRELQRIARVEDARPYYEFSNLAYDPRVLSQSAAVVKSPLAQAPVEAFVELYFQVQPKLGRAPVVTLPRLNEEFPAFSTATPRDRQQLALLQAQSQTVYGLAKHAAAGAGTSVALSSSQYQMTQNSNAVYQQQQVQLGNRQGSPCGGEEDRSRLMVTMLAYQAATLADPGQPPRLLAMRSVQTPDGALAQGLLLSSEALGAWLLAKQANARLVPATDEVGPSTLGANLMWTNGTWRVVAPVERVPWGQLAMQVAPISVAAMLSIALVVWTLLRTERLAKQKSQFAAAAAHELRTPLAGLQLYGDMLADGLGDPTKAPQYARRVSDEASRLGRVVANMLGISQLERGKLRVTLAKGDVGDVVRDVVSRVAPSFASNGAVVEAAYADNSTAQFDRDAVTQIVTNLLDNAEKYSRVTNAASPKRVVRVEVVRTSAHVEIVVADQGPGIATPQKLFVPFFRGSADGDADKPAGLGLGLALSRNLAAAMGGTLTYSRADGTTKFTLALPAV